MDPLTKTHATPSRDGDANLGIYDGEVSHEEINRAVAGAAKSVLFGEQTRLPHFPDDQRLLKLHAGDPLVLFLWKVLKKVPERLREAIIFGPISITLVRDDTLLCFRDCRHHQAVHIGRRRRTIYLPEILLHQAEEKGYDYWAIAEGIIFAAWMLLDYLLLVDLLTAYGDEVQSLPTLRLTGAHLRGMVVRHNRHRREHPEAMRCEVHEFVEGYRAPLARVSRVNAQSSEPFVIARSIFQAELEQRWSMDKMERIAEVFDYPRMFLFDRDIIHGAARALALRKGQDIMPSIFDDVLHDYRDARRFDPAPLMKSFCRGIVPKPRADFIEEVVRLGEVGLNGFFRAYQSGAPEALDLVHPLWIYLCSLSSDPAGVFARVGKCRAAGRNGGGDSVPGAVAGILVRLDRSPHYREFLHQLEGMGEAAREELAQLISRHGLNDDDEWATFKMKKQAIVASACEILDELDGEGRNTSAQVLADRQLIHEDPIIVQLLDDKPHRLTCDPSGMLMLVRSYRRSLSRFGAADPDTSCLLASIIVRLNLSEHYRDLLGRLRGLGPPAISALYQVLEQVSERDEKRAPILDQARRMLGSLLLERQQRARSRRRALPLARFGEQQGDDEGAADSPSVESGGAAFVSLRRFLTESVPADSRTAFPTPSREATDEGPALESGSGGEDPASAPQR